MEAQGRALGDLYIDTVKERLCRHEATNSDADLTIAYTAMHGVGYPWIQDVFSAFNLPPVVPTPAQIDPDPTFPTVTLPNPEEGKVCVDARVPRSHTCLGRLTLAAVCMRRDGAGCVGPGHGHSGGGGRDAHPG